MRRNKIIERGGILVWKMKDKRVEEQSVKKRFAESQKKVQGQEQRD